MLLSTQHCQSLIRIILVIECVCVCGLPGEAAVLIHPVQVDFGFKKSKFWFDFLENYCMTLRNSFTWLLKNLSLFYP